MKYVLFRRKLLTLLGCWLASVAVGQAQVRPVAQVVRQDPSQRTWWKEAVVYEIYPRSFQDSNGDGIGDLRGITSRLDYLKSLGVGVVWLNPMFPSPNADNGYDISDYRGIAPEYGTMADFDALLRGLHQRGIKLVLDLVANHTSDEHPWFAQSRASRTNPYRDYYHWWPAEKGQPPYRRTFFSNDTEAWQYDAPTNSYYLHYYAAKQPDLNWENPQVRQEVYGLMRFWLDKGLDGFRMDVIPFISKDTTWPVLAAEQRTPLGTRAYYANGPHLHEYLREMNQQVLTKYDMLSVGEASGVGLSKALDFIAPDRHELDMIYHFEGRNISYTSAQEPYPVPNYNFLKFKQVYTAWDSLFAQRNAWGTIFLGNHDVPRMVSRWGDDRPPFRAVSSKLLTTFLLTMRGTPYYMMGDELGMTSAHFTDIRDYRDIKTVNPYRELAARQGDTLRFLADQKVISRDNARTPFQWDAAPHAGFTTGTPWLKVNPNYATINEAAEDKNPASVLNYFRQAMRLRRQHPVLVYGQYQLLDRANPHIYAYTRTLGKERVLVVLNFASEPHTWAVPAGLKLGSQPLLNNYPTWAAGQTLALQPWQAVVVAVAN